MTRPLPQQDLDHILTHTEHLWEDLRGRSLFLTGGTEFVGTWLLESLLWASDKLDLRVTVVVLTRNPERFRGKAPHLAGHPAVRLLQGDVTSFAFPEGEYPFVIHAATEPGFLADSERPLSTFDVDLLGTRRVLEFAKLHGVRRYLFTSSGAVYGRQPEGMTHIPEDYPGAPSTMEPNSAYGQAKRASEFMSMMYGRVYGFDANIARLFAFVGPHLPLDANYAVGNFIRDALKGGPIRINGDGMPFRSYLYAADLAIWLWTILLRGQSLHPYNVGSSIDISIAQLAHEVAKMANGKVDIRIALSPVPGVSPLHYVPETTRARQELGLTAKISLPEAIRSTMDWQSQKYSVFNIK
jgi:dTDP-glucose 4,6-dehydratase